MPSLARLAVRVHACVPQRRSRSPRLARREFGRRLWGDIWFHEEQRVFRRKAPVGRSDVPRSFVHFILEPLYKVYSQVIGEWRYDQTVKSDRL